MLSLSCTQRVTDFQLVSKKNEWHSIRIVTEILVSPEAIPISNILHQLDVMKIGITGFLFKESFIFKQNLQRGSNRNILIAFFDGTFLGV